MKKPALFYKTVKDICSRVFLQQYPKPAASPKLDWTPESVANFIAVGKNVISKAFRNLDVEKSKAYFQTYDDGLYVSFTGGNEQSTAGWVEEYLAKLKKYIPQQGCSLPKDKSLEKIEGDFISAIKQASIANAQYSLGQLVGYKLTTHQNYASLVAKVSVINDDNHGLSGLLNRGIESINYNTFNKELLSPKIADDFIVMNVNGNLLRSIKAGDAPVHNNINVRNNLIVLAK